MQDICSLDFDGDFSFSLFIIGSTFDFGCEKFHRYLGFIAHFFVTHSSRSLHLDIHIGVVPSDTLSPFLLSRELTSCLWITYRLIPFDSLAACGLVCGLLL